MPTRREFLGISAGVVGGLVVGVAGTLLVRPSTAGTTTEGGTGTVTRTLTQTQTATATQNLADLGTLTMAIDLSPLDSPDPSASLGNDGSWIAINNAYQDFLQFRYPDFANVGPMVLQSITPSSDGLTWTGTLAKGATFADGTGITSADLVYTVQRGLRVNSDALAAPYFGFIGVTDPNQISAPDANTVQITLPIAYTPSLVQATMCDLVWGVVNQKLAEGHAVAMSETSTGGRSSAGTDGGHAWMNAGNSAGSGPFVITEWVTEDHVTMIANQSFWGSPKPKLDKVIFQHVATPDAELLLLQKGEVDVIYDALPSQVAANQYSTGLLASESAQATTSFLWLNQSKAPFNAGPDVWNAVKAAVDYDGLINQVLLGAGVEVQTLSWKGLAGYDPNTPFQQDPAQVKQLLTQAGFPDGISFTLTYNIDDSIVGVYAPKLQSDLAACGITVTLQGTPGGQMATDESSGNFQALTTWEGGGLQHIANNAWWNLDPRAGFFAKWTDWTSAMAEQLVDATKTATGANFQTACQAMTEWALTNSPSVSLFQRNKQILMSSSVVGLAMPFARDNLQFSGVYKQGVSGFS